ncbi:MAG: hypothetical protein KC449_08380 [Anaerolineales bacterium]|nr:hypothetical protein [Anaerolineales bacterium]
MDTLEIVTLIGSIVAIILGLYGAILSTILAVREKKKERRQIKVFLEFVNYVEQLQLSIINVGFRPVTIKSVSMTYGGEAVPNGGLESYQLPQIISDGDQITLPINRAISNYWTSNKSTLDIRVYDAEGNVFVPGQIRYMDAKWGGMSES